MKTLKIINGVFWAIIAIVLNIMVVYYWGKQGCPIKSLVLGCAMYTAFSIFGWLFFHLHYNEIEGGK